MKLCLIIGSVLLILICQVSLSQDHGMDDMNIPGEGVCHMTGDTNSSAYQKLNLHKNRYDVPTEQDLDPQATLHRMLEPGDDTNRWSMDKAAEITGFVVDIQRGGVETCNCHTKQTPYMDTHITLAETDNPTAPTQQVIVEVTPRVRSLMQQQSIDWSTDTLETQLTGHWIRVKGWMLFDFAHKGESENTKPGGPNNWRATAWEIHPIMSIDVVAPPAPLQPLGEEMLTAPPGGASGLPRRRVWRRQFDLLHHHAWVRFPGKPAYRLIHEVNEGRE